MEINRVVAPDPPNPLVYKLVERRKTKGDGTEVSVLEGDVPISKDSLWTFANCLSPACKREFLATLPDALQGLVTGIAVSRHFVAELTRDEEGIFSLAFQRAGSDVYPMPYFTNPDKFAGRIKLTPTTDPNSNDATMRMEVEFGSNKRLETIAAELFIKRLEELVGG